MTRLTTLVALLLAMSAIASGVEAQAPPPTGTIAGTIRNGTAGASTPTLTVQLIAIPRSGPVTSQQVVTAGGRFRFKASADANLTYLLRTEYAGVSYLDDAPVLISPELPTVQREITVWETTAERPALRIDTTTVTIEGIERDRGALTVQREDQVLNPSDRVYIGGQDRITYRAPAPTNTLAVQAAETFDGKTAVEGQTITSTRPMRPGVTSIVTTAVVGYDRAAGSYRLRVTAPLPTALTEVWVPERFARNLRTESGARRESRERGGERSHIARATVAVREGESLLVTLEDLSGMNPANPLTSERGAAIAAGLALAVLAGGVTLLVRARTRVDTEATTDESAS